MTYSDKLNNPKWQKKRLKIMERDKFKCTCCSDDKTQLHVHHISYRRVPWTVADDQLLTLCDNCHKFVENLKKKGYNPKKIIKHWNTRKTSYLFVIKVTWEADIFCPVNTDYLIIAKPKEDGNGYQLMNGLPMSEDFVDILKNQFKDGL